MYHGVNIKNLTGLTELKRFYSPKTEKYAEWNNAILYKTNLAKVEKYKIQYSKDFILETKNGWNALWTLHNTEGLIELIPGAQKPLDPIKIEIRAKSYGGVATVRLNKQIIWKGFVNTNSKVITVPKFEVVSSLIKVDWSTNLSNSKNGSDGLIVEFPNKC